MPFFSRQTEPEPEPQHEEPARKHGLLGSLRRDPSPTPTTSTQATGHSNSTYRTSHSSATDRPSRGGSLLHKFRGGSNEELDPSIVQARERVMGAEAAEREADRALELARREVREAREEVKRIEIEAKEEARRAKIKAFHAKDIGKRGKALGRKSASLTESLRTELLTVRDRPRSLITSALVRTSPGKIPFLCLLLLQYTIQALS